MAARRAPVRGAGAASRPRRRRGEIRQVGPLAVADVEQVAQHRDRVALLAFAEQGRTPARRGAGRAGRAARLSRPVTAWMVVRRSKVCSAAPGGIAVGELALPWRERCSASAGDRIAPTSSGRASSSVRRMASPPGTSPTPVWPALSVRMTRLRVKNGPCAPLRLSSMLSCPATGMTRISITTGAPDGFGGVMDCSGYHQ